MSEPLVETFGNAIGFSAESRFLDGHFAGNPIVPGAVLVAYLAGHLDTTGRALARVERMKFRRTLMPGVPFEVRLTSAAGAGRAEFRDGTGVFATARIGLRTGNG